MTIEPLSDEEHFALAMSHSWTMAHQDLLLSTELLRYMRLPSFLLPAEHSQWHAERHHSLRYELPSRWPSARGRKRWNTPTHPRRVGRDARLFAYVGRYVAASERVDARGAVVGVDLFPEGSQHGAFYVGAYVKSWSSRVLLVHEDLTLNFGDSREPWEWALSFYADWTDAADWIE